MKKLICFIAVLLSPVVGHTLGGNITLGDIVEGGFYKISGNELMPLRKVKIVVSSELEIKKLVLFLSTRDVYPQLLKVVVSGFLREEETCFVALTEGVQISMNQETKEMKEIILQGMMTPLRTSGRLQIAPVISQVTHSFQLLRFVDSNGQPLFEQPQSLQAVPQAFTNPSQLLQPSDMRIPLHTLCDPFLELPFSASLLH